MAQDIHSNIRRDKLDIILKILSSGNEPLKKTHILYRCGINYYQLSRYLELLIKSGMIEQISEPFQGYRTTEKGRILLSLFDVRIENPEPNAIFAQTSQVDSSR